MTPGFIQFVFLVSSVQLMKWGSIFGNDEANGDEAVRQGCKHFVSRSTGPWPPSKKPGFERKNWTVKGNKEYNFYDSIEEQFLMML